jgi:hypothetical protein
MSGDRVSVRRRMLFRREGPRDRQVPELGVELLRVEPAYALLEPAWSTSARP